MITPSKKLIVGAFDRISITATTTTPGRIRPLYDVSTVSLSSASFAAIPGADFARTVGIELYCLILSPSDISADMGSIVLSLNWLTGSVCINPLVSSFSFICEVIIT